jgi:hypothetical protein
LEIDMPAQNQTPEAISNQIAGLIEAESLVQKALESVHPRSWAWDKLYNVRGSLQKSITEYFAPARIEEAA